MLYMQIRKSVRYIKDVIRTDMLKRTADMFMQLVKNKILINVIKILKYKILIIIIIYCVSSTH